MKSKKLLGITLISSAVLLQVGYASSEVQYPVVNAQAFDVYFQDAIVIKASEQVEVKVEERSNGIDIQVGNLYPGATFDIGMHIRNYGNIVAQIKDIQLKVAKGTALEDGKTYNMDLMDMLVGYDETGIKYSGDAAYNAYLAANYEGKQLKKGESMPLRFSIGMAPEIEGLQNQKVAFSIQIDLEQVTDGSGSGGGSGTDDGNGEGGNIVTPDKPNPDLPILDPSEGNEEEFIEPEEGILDGTQDVNPDKEAIETSEDGIPGKMTESLPKTGGITPGIVYTVGFALFAGGIIVYRKKEDE